MDQVIEFFKRTIQTSGTSVTRPASSFKRPENNQNKKSTRAQIPISTVKSASAPTLVQSEEYDDEMEGQKGDHDKSKDGRRRRWVNGEWVYDEPPIMLTEPPLVITTPPPQLPELARPPAVQRDWSVPVIFSSFISTMCVLFMIVLIVSIIFLL